MVHKHIHTVLSLSALVCSISTCFWLLKICMHDLGMKFSPLLCSLATVHKMAAYVNWLKSMYPS